MNEKKGVEWYYMKTCPNCGFEPLNGDLICPNCKAEIKENIAKKISEDQIDHPETSEAIENDNIEWSELKEISLGEVMDQFHNLYDETSQDDAEEPIKTVDRPERDLSETKVEEFEDDPILAAYLKAYKEGRHLEAQEEIKDLIRQKEEQETKSQEVIEQQTPKESSSQESQLSVEKESNEEAIAQEEPEEEAVVQEELVEDAGSENQLEPEGLEAVVVSTDPTIKETVENPEEPKVEEPEAEQSTETLASDSIEAKVVETSQSIIEEITEENSLPKPEATQKIEQAAHYLEQESANKSVPSSVEEVEMTIPADRLDPKATIKNEAVVPKRKARTKWSKKKKRIVWYTVAVIAIISISGGAYYAHEQELERQAQAELVKKEASVASLMKDIQALSVSKEEPIVKASTTKSQLTEYQKQLTALKGIKEEKEASQFVDTLITQYTLQEDLNKQFNTPVLVDGKVNDQAYVLNTQTFLAVPIKDATAFDQAYNQAVTLGQKQVEQAQTVKEAVTKLTSGLKNNQLAASVTTQTYTNTLKQVQALKDETLKTELTNQLTPIKTALAKRDADQKAAKEKEEKAQAEQAAKEKAQAEQAAKENELIAKINQNTQYSQANQVLSSTTAVNKDNRPIIASRQSDLDYASNSAWEWADGVYDSVINQCIARGYIVPGGFYLQRVRIENGQGYYNLYATTNQSSLLKDVGEQGLPMYIATINDKTGFFKGNGSGTN